MKSSIFITLLIAAATVVTTAQARYSTYDNDRFYFSIQYPSDLLTMQPPPANNDGRTFLSTDGKVELRAWGQFNALERTLKQQYEDALSENRGVTYNVLGSNSFTISGRSAGRIYYQRTLYRKSGDTEVFYTFTIAYPTSMKTKMDAVVKRIAKSFKFDPNAEP